MKVQVKEPIASAEHANGSKKRALPNKGANDAIDIPDGANIKKMKHKTVIEVSTGPKSSSRSFSMKDRLKLQRKKATEDKLAAIRKMIG